MVASMRIASGSRSLRELFDAQVVSGLNGFAGWRVAVQPAQPVVQVVHVAVGFSYV
jgi:hypothetical protein